MRKLKLDLDALEVTSFETHDDGDGRGTVAGHLHQQAEPNTEAWMDTCNGCASAYGTCMASCNLCGSQSACAICLID